MCPIWPEGVMEMGNNATTWSAWQLDHITWGWIAWMIFFFGWETYSLVFHKGNELTAHLRPVFQTYDLIYFLAVGLWLWIGWHFLVDGLWTHEWGVPRP